MKKFLLFIFFLSFSYLAYPQNITNVSAHVESENIVIKYDLNAPKGYVYEIDIYSSKDQFSSPLKNVKGDVGEGVKPGKGRTVYWEAYQELGQYSGKLSFEVKGEPVFIPYTFKSPVNGEEFGKGNSISLKWSGGNPNKNESVTINLYKNGTKVKKIATVENKGKYKWTKTDNTEIGPEYRIQLESSSSYADPVKSPPFYFKKKSRTLYYVIGSVAVAGIAFIIWDPIGLFDKGDDSKTEDNQQQKKDSNLPPPPNP